MILGFFETCYHLRAHHTLIQHQNLLLIAPVGKKLAKIISARSHGLSLYRPVL
ncbi:hypothetical protein Hanom_Chr17g01582531 [Helianthus anomalus]